MTEHKIVLSDTVNPSDSFHIEKIVIVDNEKNVENPIDIRHLSPANNSTLVNILISTGAIVVGGTVLQINEIMLDGVTREDILILIKTFIKIMEYKN